MKIVLFASLVAALSVNASQTVSNSKELAEAFSRISNGQNSGGEIVLKSGVYFMDKTLEAKAVTGLTFRAEKPGTVEICGGERITGWKKVPGTPFWSAPAKNADGTPAFFRSLVKNGEWVPISVLPGGTNRFEHTVRFGAFLLPNLAGHWSRKPTDEEYRVMKYLSKDIPDTMDLTSADIHLLHMWDDSLCTVEKVDRANRTLTVKEQPNWPMGAKEKFEYEIFNIREGMKCGRWFLDRKAGVVYYQPFPGEDVAKLEFVRPSLKNVLVINGGRDIKFEGISISGATPSLGQNPGFGGIASPAALALRGIKGLELNGVTIKNTAGVGLSIGGSSNVVIDECSLVSCGACAAFISAGNVVFKRSLVSDAGCVHRASSGVFVSGSDIVLCENEIRNVPYSGLIGFGNRNRFETNFIHHVMQVLHDGAAIYGLHVNGIMRGNIVKDVVALGKGFGVHAYYADENSRNTIIEDNYAEGMPVPIHNHMSANIIVRNNTLVNMGGDMVVSFERCVESEFSGNRIFCDGKLDTVWLDGIARWNGNVVYSGKATPFEWNPPRVAQEKREDLPVARAPKAPVLDGVFAEGEWAGDFYHIDRDGKGHQTGFSSALVRLAWDNENLYGTFLAANFGNGKMSFGSTWGRDDGVELDFGSGRVVRAFHTGETSVLPAALSKEVKIVALGKGKNKHSNPNLLRVEFSMPWKALNITPKKGLSIPFNARAYQSEFKQMKTYDADSSGCCLVLE